MKNPFKLIDYFGWKLWTKLFQQWISDKFGTIAAAIDNIHIDFSSIEGKLDNVKTAVADVKGDVADVKYEVGDVKTAVENIDFSSVNEKIDAVGEKIDALDDKVTPYLYDPCTADDIDHMFDANTEDGQIIIPAEAVQPDGSISLNLFTAITGLTPVVVTNEQG